MSSSERLLLISFLSCLILLSNLGAPRPTQTKSGLLPPDHLDAVRLEVDAHLNRDYRREVFFGEDHDKVEPQSKQEADVILRRLFLRVDENKDGYWTGNEVESWVMKNIQEHLAAARLENDAMFSTIDFDKDGFISLREFQIELLVALGYNRSLAERYPDDPSVLKLGDVDTTPLSRNRYRWSQADMDINNRLNRTEFLAFRHPELSETMMNHMVSDMMNNLDKNSDGVLSEAEFAPLPPGEVELPFAGIVNDDNRWQQERLKEFRVRLDLDHDGKASVAELKSYVDPASPSQAATESRSLFQLADHNKDNRLSLAEIVENYELFIGSKLVNVARSFHVEL